MHNEFSIDLEIENYKIANFGQRLYFGTQKDILLSTELGKLEREDLEELAEISLDRLDNLQDDVEEHVKYELVEEYESLDNDFDDAIENLSEKFKTEYAEKLDNEELVEDMQEFIALELDKFSTLLKEQIKKNEVK